MLRLGVLVVLSVALVAILPIGAFAIPPALARQYQPLPVDTNVFFLGYTHLDSNTGLDESIPLSSEADIDVNGGVAVYLRYLNVGGSTAYVWASLPGASADAAIDTTLFGTVARSTSGIGQPVLGFSYGYKGAPAMTLQEFVTWRQTTTLNAAFYVSPPLGTYDRDRLLNVATNRWQFKPEFTWAHRHGKWLAEVYGHLQFYTDNKEFLGSNTLSQSPSYGLDGHFSYDFNPKTWASLDVYQAWGGRVSVNDRKVVPSQAVTSLGFTVSHSLDPANLLLLVYQKTVSGGSRDVDVQAINFLYGHVW